MRRSSSSPFIHLFRIVRTSMMASAVAAAAAGAPQAAHAAQAQARPTIVLVHGAFAEASAAPASRGIPSWFIHGDADLNIPPAAMNFMARRAGSRHTKEVKGASHVVMASHPAEVARMIVEAAAAAEAVAAR